MDYRIKIVDVYQHEDSPFSVNCMLYGHEFVLNRTKEGLWIKRIGPNVYLGLEALGEIENEFRIYMANLKSIGTV